MGDPGLTRHLFVLGCWVTHSTFWIPVSSLWNGVTAPFCWIGQLLGSNWLSKRLCFENYKMEKEGTHLWNSEYRKKQFIDQLVNKSRSIWIIFKLLKTLYLRALCLRHYSSFLMRRLTVSGQNRIWQNPRGKMDKLENLLTLIQWGPENLTGVHAVTLMTHGRAQARQGVVLLKQKQNLGLRNIYLN